MSRRINTAGFLGALFKIGIALPSDVGVCLETLFQDDGRADCLCAIHALVAQAGINLCSLNCMKQFRAKVHTMVASITIEWCAAPTPDVHSKLILVQVNFFLLPLFSLFLIQ